MRRYNHEQIAQAISSGELDVHLDDFERVIRERRKLLDLACQVEKFKTKLQRWNAAKESKVLNRSWRVDQT